MYFKHKPKGKKMPRKEAAQRLKEKAKNEANGIPDPSDNSKSAIIARMKIKLTELEGLKKAGNNTEKLKGIIKDLKESIRRTEDAKKKFGDCTARRNFISDKGKQYKE